MTGTTRELEVVGPTRGPYLQLSFTCEEESPMKGPLTIIGIVLLVLGLISFAYQGITYTKSEKVLEVGPITTPTIIQRRGIVRTLCSHVPRPQESAMARI